MPFLVARIACTLGFCAFAYFWATVLVRILQVSRSFALLMQGGAICGTLTALGFLWLR